MRRAILSVLLLALLVARPAAAGAHRGPVLEAPTTVRVGQAFLVAVVAPEPTSALALTWRGRSVPLVTAPGAAGYRAEALLGTDVSDRSTGPAVLAGEVRSAGRSWTVAVTLSVLPGTFAEERLSVPAAMVEPPAPALPRIAGERAAVASVLRSSTPTRAWALPFARPVPGRAGSTYGLRRFFNGAPRAPHRGQDFKAPLGEPVRACASGRVALVGDHYFAGTSVYVDHGQGVVTGYFHLSRALVKAGQAVGRGAVLGAVGSSGRATGPHLHLAVQVPGGAVDPRPLLRRAAVTGVPRRSHAFVAQGPRGGKP